MFRLHSVITNKRTQIFIDRLFGSNCFMMHLNPKAQGILFQFQVEVAQNQHGTWHRHYALGGAPLEAEPLRNNQKAETMVKLTIKS